MVFSQDPVWAIYGCFLASTVKKKKWVLVRMAREFMKEKGEQWEGRRKNIEVEMGEHTTFHG